MALVARLAGSKRAARASTRRGLMTPDAPRIVVVDDIIFDVETRAWPFEIDEAEAIDRHWDVLRCKKPLLFNGRVFLAFENRLETRSGRPILRGAAASVDFKAFLAWRDFGFPDPGVRNCFAMAALLSADGGFILGRMSETTANGGKIYFPAGTPDLGDVKNGALDLAGSVGRELLEETGIAPDEVAFAPDWTVVFEGPRIACMKITRSPLPAAEIEARFQAFVARQAQPELVGLHAVFSVDDLDERRMPAFTLRYLRHVLGAPP
jgi:8-oxo-dGTP pyrophosphatase MutT (NUDIX family)